MKRRYTATVTVELPDDMDEGPLAALASIVLVALHEGSVPVLRCRVEEGDSE